MEIVIKPSVKVCKTIGKNGKVLDNGAKLSLSTYCVVDKVKMGYLIYNTLYLSMVLLTEEEYGKMLTYDSSNSYLYDYYFVVDENTDIESKIAKVQNLILKSKPKSKFEKLSTVTILPSTGCNAKCFYCFEKGSEIKHMSIETAEKVVEYIKKHYNGKIMHIRWFGGEPLINEKVITYICKRLGEENINYSSKMTSNCFLINPDKVDTYKNVWRLKNMSVTIDGTAEVYNNIKQFSYSGSAYDKVIGNVDCLIANGIRTSIRINLGMHNMEDVETLINDLIEHYKGKENIKIYLNRLYDNCGGEPTPEELILVRKTIIRLSKILSKYGLGSGRVRLTHELKVTQCMADSRRATMILPDGKLGLCEHYMDELHIGDIENDVTDYETVERCCKQYDKDELCKKCFMYPTCNKIEICSSSKCSEDGFFFKKYLYQVSMRGQLRKYLREKNNNNQ